MLVRLKILGVWFALLLAIPAFGEHASGEGGGGDAPAAAEKPAEGGADAGDTAEGEGAEGEEAEPTPEEVAEAEALEGADKQIESTDAQLKNAGDENLDRESADQLTKDIDEKIDALSKLPPSQDVKDRIADLERDAARVLAKTAPPENLQRGDNAGEELVYNAPAETTPTAPLTPQEVQLNIVGDGLTIQTPVAAQTVQPATIGSEQAPIATTTSVATTPLNPTTTSATVNPISNGNTVVNNNTISNTPTGNNTSLPINRPSGQSASTDSFSNGTLSSEASVFSNVGAASTSVAAAPSPARPAAPVAVAAPAPVTPTPSVAVAVAAATPTAPSPVGFSTTGSTAASTFPTAPSSTTVSAEATGPTAITPNTATAPPSGATVTPPSAVVSNVESPGGENPSLPSVEQVSTTTYAQDGSGRVRTQSAAYTSRGISTSEATATASVNAPNEPTSIGSPSNETGNDTVSTPTGDSSLVVSVNYGDSTPTLGLVPHDEDASPSQNFSVEPEVPVQTKASALFALVGIPEKDTTTVVTAESERRFEALVYKPPTQDLRIPTKLTAAEPEKPLIPLDPNERGRGGLLDVIANDVKKGEKRLQESLGLGPRASL